MSGAPYLYRRESGIYFVRLCVPSRLKAAVGKGELDVNTSIKSDLMGHSRGTSLAETRYDKGRKLISLKAVIDRVCHQLPPIAPFSVANGLAALADAVRLKNSHAARTRRSP